jgi:chemotaxis protein methyltransferase CheR
MTNESFAIIAGLVKTRSGIVLTPDKLYMLETRLAPLLKRESLSGLDALALRLRDGRAEPLAREVISSLTTNESSFFRDGRPFEHLRRAAVAIAANRPASHRLRVWSAACSTGQEAYSIAITLSECRAAMGGRDFEILGTDISREVVERARKGVFTQFEVQRGLPIQMLVRHFKQDEGKWRISDEMAARCRFEERNLIEDTRSLGQFDVIFCRNVLIYFDTATKTKVLSALAQQLAPDGVLYLGGAETVLGLTDRLTPITGERGAYQASAGTRLTSLAS